jgi:F0F1-type ATP synthase assembly protein I
MKTFLSLLPTCLGGWVIGTIISVLSIQKITRTFVIGECCALLLILVLLSIGAKLIDKQ